MMVWKVFSVFDLIDVLWMIHSRVILLIMKLFNFGLGSAGVAPGFKFTKSYRNFLLYKLSFLF